jgi:hypothetical protein
MQKHNKNFKNITKTSQLLVQTLFLLIVNQHFSFWRRFRDSQEHVMFVPRSGFPQEGGQLEYFN